MDTVVPSDTSSYDVKTGFWTNWAHGQIHGATLTLSRRNGGILIAFVAIYVAAAGRSFWRIVCLLLHRHLSSSNPQDGLYHQRQAILRNSETASFAVLQLIFTLHAWRRLSSQVIRRLLPIILLASGLSIGFSLAGLFSSHVTTEIANEVLLIGNNCHIIEGPSNLTSPEEINATGIFLAHYSQRIQANLNYAQQCYTSVQSDESCYQYVRSKINLKVNMDASCPFEGLCKSPTSNVIVDSGLLNSNLDLGINLPRKYQFELRFVNHCAPLKTTGYRRLYNSSANYLVPQMRYYYGRFRDNDFTYQAPIFGPLKAYKQPANFKIFGKERAEYTLGMVTKYAGMETAEDNMGFKPITDFDRPDADLLLVFLSARGMYYVQPVDDPWFSAHVGDARGQLSGPALSENHFKGYLQDEPASPLGCALQAQVCNPNLSEDKKCQPLRGGFENFSNSIDLWPDAVSKAVLSWIFNIIKARHVPISEVLSSEGPSVLSARFSQAGDSPVRLPADQWKRELAYWMKASMASLQGIFVEAAIGVKDGPLLPMSRPPTNKEERQVCASQRIKSTKYSSFSVLGLSLALILGGVIIALDFTLESIINFWDKQRRRDPYQRLEWQCNEILQLQRLAHESTGVGTWCHIDKRVPTTRAGEYLAVLDIENQTHPRLKISKEALAHKDDSLGSNRSCINST